MNRHQIDEALALDASDQLLHPHRGTTELMFGAGRVKAQAALPRRAHDDGGTERDGRHERHRPNSHPEMRHARA